MPAFRAKNLSRVAEAAEQIPPLAGALVKNEQDVRLFERLAFMPRRKEREQAR